MISIYSYDKAIEILELFSQNQVVELSIKETNADAKEYTFIYKTLDEYSDEVQDKKKELFNEKNLQQITGTLAALNEFITMKETDNINFYELQFNLEKNVFLVMKDYKVPYKDVCGEIDKSEETYQEFINRFEKFITQAGIGKMEIPGLFEKVPSNGKRPKLNQITFTDLINKMKDVIVDVN